MSDVASISSETNTTDHTYKQKLRSRSPIKCAREAQAQAGLVCCLAALGSKNVDRVCRARGRVGENSRRLCLQTRDEVDCLHNRREFLNPSRVFASGYANTVNVFCCFYKMIISHFKALFEAVNWCKIPNSPYMKESNAQSFSEKARKLP